MKNSRKHIISDYFFLFIIAVSIILLDIFTKELVRQNIPLGGTWMPLDWLSPYARFVNWFNTGAAFGLFKSASSFFMILAIIVMIVIIYYFPRIPKKDWIIRVALAMQFAGAAGNFIDRVRFEGKVTDFISVGSFAVFNVADASITIGCAVLLIGSWIYDRKVENEDADEDLKSNKTPKGRKLEFDG